MFIAAERAGRTVELDFACIEAVAIGSADLPVTPMITINLSPRTLELPDFSLPHLVRTLHNAGLEPDRVVIEITERETIEEMERLKRNVAACRAAGFRVAADDVGAGNAGLRLLSQIQFDIVKIDLSLVQEGALYETSLAVVGSLQELARRWGAWVIAEGIETPEQLARRARAGDQRRPGVSPRPARIGRRPAHDRRLDRRPVGPDEPRHLAARPGPYVRPDWAARRQADEAPRLPPGPIHVSIARVPARRVRAIRLTAARPRRPVAGGLLVGRADQPAGRPERRPRRPVGRPARAIDRAKPGPDDSGLRRAAQGRPGRASRAA